MIGRPSRPLLLLLLAASALACGGATTKTDRPRTSSREFTLPDLSGKSVSLSDYADRKAVLLDFWALWCHPCRAELPRLETLHQKLADRGFALLAINVDEAGKKAEVRTFSRQRGFTFPMLLDPKTRVVSRFNPRLSLPFAVLMDGKGKVIKTYEGFQPGQEKDLEADIEQLLAGDAGGS